MMHTIANVLLCSALACSGRRVQIPISASRGQPLAFVHSASRRPRASGRIGHVHASIQDPQDAAKTIAPAYETSTSLTLQDVAETIKLGKAKSVIVMVGAGISVAAGIPDFRTPGVGLYDNLQEYGLPYPEAIFQLSYFRKNPKPFYRLCKELWPGNYKPTLSHYFITLLHNKGLLRRCYTQNIDSLETTAGLPSDALIAAHGNFDTASVQLTPGRGLVPIEEVQDAAAEGMDAWDSLNTRYGGLVKPDIVFFGEELPDRFYEKFKVDIPACDLLLVMGTSLAVQPFASLIAGVNEQAQRFLINRKRVGEDVVMPRVAGRGNFKFVNDTRDGFYKGDCDDFVRELVNLLGWQQDFEDIQRAT